MRERDGLLRRAHQAETAAHIDQPHPTRTDLARQAAEEYASELREIIDKLRKKLN